MSKAHAAVAGGTTRSRDVKGSSSFQRVFLCGILAVPVLALAGGLAPAGAEPGSIVGSWSGGGTVSLASGSKEKARCRVRYARKSASTYSLSATCATPSGRVAQTASLRKVGANSYSGTFHNAEYNTSGNIYVVVRGNSQSVRLNSAAGASASLKLSR